MMVKSQEPYMFWIGEEATLFRIPLVIIGTCNYVTYGNTISIGKPSRSGSPSPANVEVLIDIDLFHQVLKIELSRYVLLIDK